MWFFTVSFRDSGIVTAQIYLAYCYRAMGGRWAMWDTSYKQICWTLENEMSLQMAKKKTLLAEGLLLWWVIYKAVKNEPKSQT